MGNLGSTPITGPAEHITSNNLPSLVLARIMPFGSTSIPKGRILPVADQEQEKQQQQKQKEQEIVANPVRGKGRI